MCSLGKFVSRIDCLCYRHVAMIRVKNTIRVFFVRAVTQKVSTKLKYY